MMKRSIAVVFLLCVLSGLAGEKPKPVSIAVRSQWRQELFDPAHDKPLQHHRTNDVIVLTASVLDGSVMHYGHRGMIYYPTSGRVGELNSLLKGRFVVKDVEGQKRLVLDEEVSTMSATGLLAQAANDYNSLLPDIAVTSVPEGSKLVLKRLDSNDRCMHVVCPPEGWGTLYIAVRQADRMYCSDTVLTYGYTGKGYMLLECTTSHYFKGE